MYGQRLCLVQVMSCESDPGEKAKQGWGRTRSGQVGPQTLGFDANVGSSLFKGDFDGPATDEPDDDLFRRVGWIGGEQGEWVVPAFGVTDKRPADRDSRLAGMILPKAVSI